jgi:hypothetical protein
MKCRRRLKGVLPNSEMDDIPLGLQGRVVRNRKLRSAEARIQLGFHLSAIFYFWTTLVGRKYSVRFPK